MNDETLTIETKPEQLPGRWYKGMRSPNPGGRPAAVHRLQDLAREHTAEAVEKIRAIMNDPKASLLMQLAAARELLDRAYGKPATTIQGPDETPFFGDLGEGSLPVQFDVARRIAFVLAQGLTLQKQAQALPADVQAGGFNYSAPRARIVRDSCHP